MVGFDRRTAINKMPLRPLCALCEINGSRISLVCFYFTPPKQDILGIISIYLIKLWSQTMI